VIFTHELDSSIDDINPLVYGKADVLRDVGWKHGELRSHDFIEFEDIEFGAALQDFGGIPEGLAGMRGTPVECLAVVEFVADLKADDSTFGRQIFKQIGGHVAGNIVQLAQSVVGGDDGVGADIDGLQDGFVRSVRDVDEHPEAIHFANRGATVFVDAVPFGRGAAGVGIVAGPVVGGELDGAKAEAVHRADDGGIAIEIEAAFDVEDSGDFAGFVNAFDVAAVIGELDGVVITGDLRGGEIKHANRLLGFEAGGVVILGDEDREEEGTESTFFSSGEIELAVRFSFANVAAVIELAIDGMNMAIEDQ